MFRKTIIIIFVFWALSGCSQLVSAEQVVVRETRIISPDQPLGQTFVARYNGLQAIRLHLEPDIPGQGTLELHLRSGPESTIDIRLATLEINKVTHPGFYTFRFDPLQNSKSKYFYYHLIVLGAGSVKIGQAEGNTYINGALYQQKVPLDAQMTFKTSYDSDTAMIGLVKEVLRWLGYLTIAFFLYVIPGWSILSSLMPRWGRLHWAEKTALASGVSLSIYPLLLLWTDQIGLHLGPVYAWLPCTLGVSIILYHHRENLRNPPAIISHLRFLLKYLTSRSWWFDLTLIFLLIMIFVSRFWIVSSLEGPIGSDSYHHSLIVQLLNDHNGLFKSWQPYTDLMSFTYHFGFHAAVAAFRWIYPLPSYKAILWVGQIFNGLAILAIYPLAMRISRSNWTGLFAVWVAGLVSSIPMIYLNWGRYTQLTGQIIMPIMIVLAWEALEAQETNWRMIIITWIAISGLALTHYRVLLMSAFFFPSFLLFRLWGQPLRAASRKILWLGLGSGIIVLPWFIRGFSGKILDTLFKMLSTPPSANSGVINQLDPISELSFYLPYWVWLLMAVAFAWGLWKRSQPLAIIGCWWFLALLATNPDWLGLPGSRAISNKIIFLAAYIPAGILTGSLVQWIIDTFQFNSVPRRYSYIFGLTCLLSLSLSSVRLARARIEDLTPNEITLTKADLRAAAWIKTNIPGNARFLVNSHLFFTNWPLGSDAGHWLPLIANRKTTLPPMLYPAEQGPQPNYSNWVLQLPLEIQSKGVNSDKVLSLLQDRGITHVYIGQAPGPLGNDPYKIPIDQLLNDRHYRQVYHQDRVRVFEINHQ